MGFKRQSPMPVVEGGTGKQSFTAYGTVCGGTTATGALQDTGPGTANFVLTSNGAGALPTFQAAAASSLVAFNAVHSVAQNGLTGSGVPAGSRVEFTTVRFNNGAAYDGTGRFTCPTDGIYMFACAVAANPCNPTTVDWQIFFNVNGTAVLPTAYVNYFNCGAIATPAATYVVNSGGLTTLTLSATDYVEIYIGVLGHAVNDVDVNANTSQTWFAGARLLAL